MSFQRSPETTSGTVTTWIPLTTAAPSSGIDDCSAARYAAYNQPTQHELTAFDPFLSTVISVKFATRCFESEATSWWDVVRHPQTGYNQLVTVTSLGPIVCPGGYTTAATSLAGDRTHVACCPSYVLNAAINRRDVLIESQWICNSRSWDNKRRLRTVQIESGGRQCNQLLHNNQRFDIRCLAPDGVSSCYG